MSVGITEGLDNGDSDNWGPTVPSHLYFATHSPI